MLKCRLCSYHMDGVGCTYSNAPTPTNCEFISKYPKKKTNKGIKIWQAKKDKQKKGKK